MFCYVLRLYKDRNRQLKKKKRTRAVAGNDLSYFSFVTNMFLFPDSEGQHREVVTLLGVTNELVDSGGHRFNQLLGGSLKGCDDLADTLHSEKITAPILRLSQTIGIEEKNFA